jgi:hypothetical protein
LERPANTAVAFRDFYDDPSRMRAPLFVALVSAAALALGACSVKERNYGTPGSGGGGGDLL